MTRLLLLATLATAAALGRDHRLARARTARTHHEVRGPLCTARVALATLDASPVTAAIDRELARAARVLDDHDSRPTPPAGSVPAGLARHAHRLVRAGLAPFVPARARAVEGVAIAPPAGRRVDLGALVRDAEPVWRALAASRGRPLVVDAGTAGVVVAGDPGRCLQAAANLVRNAVDHGQGTIRVTAAGGRLAVTDDGPGLPVPLPRLLEGAERRRSRHGHGLAVAAAVAAEHGGALTADGARLALDLPTRSRP